MGRRQEESLIYKVISSVRKTLAALPLKLSDQIFQSECRVGVWRRCDLLRHFTNPHYLSSGAHCRCASVSVTKDYHSQMASQE